MPGSSFLASARKELPGTVRASRRIIYIMLNSGGLKGGGESRKTLFIRAGAVVPGLFINGWIFKLVGTKVKTKSLGKAEKGHS